jgi:hypothetical protein
MDEDALNLSIRRFLKQFGIAAQREMEHAVARAVADGALRGDETLAVRATLVVERLVPDFRVDGEITLR